MGLTEEKTRPVIDMGDYSQVFLNGIAEDIEFLPNDMVRLKGYQLVEHCTQQKVVECCLWSIPELLKAAMLIESKLAEHGYLRHRLLRAN